MSANGKAYDGQAKGAHPYKVSENTNIATELSHWSLIWNAGFNSFDGDFNSEMKHPIWVPSVGMGLEYSFTPYIGLGIEYMFDMYRVFGEPGNADILLAGQMHRAGAYLSWDLMTQFFPKANRKIFSIHVLLGGGASVYKHNLAYDDNTRGNTLGSTPISMDKYKVCPYLLGGVNFEFNVSRGVALGIRGAYSYFTRDDVDGRGIVALASKNNDGIFDVSLNLRYKIDAVRKTHVRNIPSERIADRKGNENVVQQISLSGDGKDTVIIYYRDTVIYRTEIQKEVVAPVTKKENLYFVYFDNGRSNLSTEGVIAVQQIATRMKHEKDNYAVIAGYCDNTGSENRNRVLSDERANVVAQELIEEHNIDPAHIATCGKGILVNCSGKRIAYAANRRAEVQLVSKEEFDAFLQSCENVAMHGTKAGNEDDSIRESANTHSETSIGGEVIDEIVVTKNMTLAKLARKYYHNNTHCWVFIYEANRQVIANPNNLNEGTKLLIPALDEKQMQISKEESSKMYRRLQ